MPPLKFTKNEDISQIDSKEKKEKKKKKDKKSKSSKKSKSKSRIFDKLEKDIFKNLENTQDLEKLLSCIDNDKDELNQFISKEE
jgi:serine/threonine-protein kinase RIO1